MSAVGIVALVVGSVVGLYLFLVAVWAVLGFIGGFADEAGIPHHHHRYPVAGIPHDVPPPLNWDHTEISAPQNRKAVYFAQAHAVVPEKEPDRLVLVDYEAEV